MADSDQIGGPVVHPHHYNQGGPIDADGSAQFETIKIIEDLGWGFAFCMGNALKYVLRAPHKGAEIEDLKKTQWYLLRARSHRGLVRPRANQKLTANDVVAAWGLLEGPAAQAAASAALAQPEVDSEYIEGVDRLHGIRLALTVNAIMIGDPHDALNNLNLYLLKLSAERG